MRVAASQWCNSSPPTTGATYAKGRHSVLTAIVKTPTPSLVDACELTFLDRVPIDFDLLLAQHAAYREALARAGAHVITLDVGPNRFSSARRPLP
jgi:hypothetical protein